MIRRKPFGEHILDVLAVQLIGIPLCALFAWPVWNWWAPAIFGLPSLNYWKVLAIVAFWSVYHVGPPSRFTDND